MTACVYVCVMCAYAYSAYYLREQLECNMWGKLCAMECLYIILCYICGSSTNVRVSPAGAFVPENIIIIRYKCSSL